MAPPQRPLLSLRTIKALVPMAARYDLYDRDLRGFSIRVHPSGLKTYRYKYVAAGRQRVMTIGEHGSACTPEHARARAEMLRGQIRAGVDPRQEAIAAQQAREQHRLTVADLIERWLREGPIAAPNKRATSWDHDASRLRRHIVPLLGDLAAGSLRRADIERAQRQIAEGATAVDERTKARGRAIVRGGATVARSAVVSLSSCYAWAVAHEILTDNPVRRVRKFAAAKRERFLTEAEVARLLTTLDSMQRQRQIPDAFADAVRVLMFSGARKSEIASLAWSEVDLASRFIRLPPARSKTGAKQITLNEPAMAVLRARVRKGPYVFASERKPGTPIVGLQKIWTQVRERAGLADLRIHDLRHAFASFAAADGASLSLIARALGHSQTATTERYAHLGDEGVRRMSERVGATIINASDTSISTDPACEGRLRAPAKLRGDLTDA